MYESGSHINRGFGTPKIVTGISISSSSSSSRVFRILATHRVSSNLEPGFVRMLCWKKDMVVEAWFGVCVCVNWSVEFMV